jgi:hypothetical protein
MRVDIFGEVCSAPTPGGTSFFLFSLKHEACEPIRGLFERLVCERPRVGIIPTLLAGSRYGDFFQLFLPWHSLYFGRWCSSLYAGL